MKVFSSKLHYVYVHIATRERRVYISLSNVWSINLSQIMDPCKEREPGVINNELLEKCIKQQFPPGEAGRLALEEGIPLTEIEHLRLEHLSNETN